MLVEITMLNTAMLIRKNTKAFKTIVEIITACQSRADREKLIRLYITKAGHSLHDRISVEGIQGEAALFYEMNYQAVLNSLKSSNHQLHVSDDVAGIYFLHSSSNKVWDETPFEFDEAIKKEFSSLPELPAVRKKEKAEKFVFPAPKIKSEPPPVKKEKVATVKVASAVEKEPKQPRQPDYKLKHKIHFTDLEKVIFRQARLSKKDIIGYYNNIAEYILPYLKDRPQLIRIHADNARATPYPTSEGLQQAKVTLPDWIKTADISKEKEEHVLLCNDREHLLWYTDIGCVEFHPCHSRIKFPDSPDYIVIGIESPESELGEAIDVALTAKSILTGLQLPSFVKTDGLSALHIYIPLDAKSNFETSRSAAEYICGLTALKIPDLVTLKGADDYVYGKVSLDHTLNEAGQSVVAPYSLMPGELPTVATPLLWEEVEDGLRPEDFNHESIFKRLKQVGDPFEALFKKKVNADVLLERLEENYGFLF